MNGASSRRDQEGGDEGRPYGWARWLAACLVLVAAVPVLAQSGGGYDLSWSTVDAGGGMFSTGEGYSLGGTAGQPDAGLMAEGGYVLAGGFWGGGAPAPPEMRLFLPLAVSEFQP